ncbi:TlpA family protein disulfide reductase [Ulvibacter antarcticus]|uniref:Thiol-disulfide isomerase/thioredoxin n=1 Tax=Ulvibacter antarcticus TaxID=442714 RepID=A0A3L9YVV7_9FLAO|nr:TlpA disulfide reductase family protein [Ulvibacter antarcticus]RMA64643.1 thiol-disulfide isomerase/thioredoxin [Ulvibacter antarcticus]
MIKKLLLLLLLASFTAHSQEIGPENLFSTQIGKNIKQYRQKSQDAYANKDFERAEFLFDSLINNVVNDSYLDNFKVKKLSGRKVELYDFEKPVFLITYASWCTTGVGEIPALNELAEKYHKDIDFVLLFWDSKDKVRKTARKYSSKFTVLYVDEKENTHDHIVETMKHSLGFPTSFFITKEKQIVDVRRGILHPYNEEFNSSYNMHYNAYLNGISLLKNLNLDAEDGYVSKLKP